MGIFGSLGVGTKALSASQMAISVAGQNIANANTEGYSRKRVSVSADVKRDSAFGELGNGVNIESVERIRNQFIDLQIDSQTTKKGYLEGVDDALERIENVFNEPSDVGLNNTIDSFWNSWQDLANSPNDLSARQAVRSTTEVLTSQFHAIAGELREFKISMDRDLENQVKIINNVTSEISRLNNEIALAELDGSSMANDSRDKRTELVKDLATEIPIDFFEDGDGRLTITTSGNIIVGPREVISIDMFRERETQPDGTVISKVFTQFDNTNAKFSPSGGALGAAFAIRDDIIGNYEDKLDGIASSLVSEVNELHLQGYDLDKDTGVYFFDPNYTSAIQIELSDSIKDDIKNIAAGAGEPEKQAFGLPVTQAVSLDGSIDVSDPALNASFDPRFNDLIPGSVVITLAATGQTLTEGAANDFVVDYQNGNIVFTNGILVPPGTAVDLNFKYNDAGFGGVGDGDNALNISGLRDVNLTTPDSTGDNTQTIGEYYASFIGELGIARNEASSNLETSEFLLIQLKQRQDSIAGVSLDEELADLIKFENTYQAAAKYISTLDQMLEILLGL
jgi:flagellar hook-associated protein 1 FlgK